METTDKTPTETPFGVYTNVRSRMNGPLGHGTRWLFTFDNGYAASVIDYGYGSDQGLFELAVLDGDGWLKYDTPITNDVEGHLTPLQVANLLHDISQLPTWQRSDVE